MKQRISIVFCAILLTSLLASCSTTSSFSEQPQIEAVPPQSVIITDHLGREVEMNGDVDRIVSGYYVSSSMLLALGLEDRIVAIEAKADSRPIYILAAPELLSLPNVGSAKQFDLEGCIAQNPDLVILPIRLSDAVSSLESLGIPVIAINPETDELLQEAMEMIALATNTIPRYQQWIDVVESVTNELLAVIKTTQKRIYHASNSDLLSTATKAMYQHGQITLAGGTNVAAELSDNYWSNISYEQLIQYDPDVIILPPAASYTVDDVYNNPALATLRAVRERQVFAMPYSIEAWDSPLPLSVLGALWLNTVLYPSENSQDQLNEMISYLYHTFYSLDLSSEVLAS